MHAFDWIHRHGKAREMSNSLVAEPSHPARNPDQEGWNWINADQATRGGNPSKQKQASLALPAAAGSSASFHPGSGLRYAQGAAACTAGRTADPTVRSDGRRTWGSRRRPIEIHARRHDFIRTDACIAVVDWFFVFMSCGLCPVSVLLRSGLCPLCSTECTVLRGYSSYYYYVRSFGNDRGFIHDAGAAKLVWLGKWANDKSCGSWWCQCVARSVLQICPIVHPCTCMICQILSLGAHVI